MPDDTPNTPFRAPRFEQFVLKMHRDCDLACDYCYVYTMAERSRTRPRMMSPAVVEQAARRIGAHTRAHRTAHPTVILHGGEPLLAGVDQLADTVRRVRAHAGPGTRIGVQTNATRLGPGYLDLFAELDVRVGVSLDGGPEAHDRHRRRAAGAGSHALVDAGLRRLTAPGYRRLFSGLLCTIDLDNDPIDTYQALLAYRPPSIDFLLPHANHVTPPPGRVPDSPDTSYADWLIAVFERWHAAARRETGVRLFEEIIAVLLGGRSRVEDVGRTPVGVVVIETDGGIERSDHLKSTYPGAGATGLHVARDPLDAALPPGTDGWRTPLPPGDCRTCRIARVCGGGLHAHRYHAERGFAGPSVYCPDLYRLITHIAARLTADVDAIRRV